MTTLTTAEAPARKLSPEDADTSAAPTAAETPAQKPAADTPASSAGAAV